MIVVVKKRGLGFKAANFFNGASPIHSPIKIKQIISKRDIIKKETLAAGLKPVRLTLTFQ